MRQYNEKVKLILQGCPLSTNHIYKYTCRGTHSRMYMTEQGTYLKESYQLEAMSQWRGPILACPVAIKVELYFDRKAKHDIDNYCKLLLDSLTGVVWQDDSQIELMTISKGYSKQHPRIEITVAPCVPA